MEKEDIKLNDSGFFIGGITPIYMVKYQKKLFELCDDEWLFGATTIA